MILSIYLHQKPYYKHVPTLFLYIVLLSLVSPLLVLAQDHDSQSFRTASNPIIMGFVLAIVTVIVVAMVIVLILCWQSRRWRRVRAVGTGPGYRASVGLDPSIVESFPVFKYSEVATHQAHSGPLECAVCLSPFQPEEKLRLLPKCNHVFHVECLDPWLKGHSTCPLCRAHLTPELIELDQVVESGQLNRLEGEVSEGGIDGNDVAEVRVDIEEGHIRKNKRWKSMGHVVESDRGEKECWKRYTLLLPEKERMMKFDEVTYKFKRTRSSI